jgi:catalase
VSDGFEITPEQVVDGVNERYGRHPGYRTLHAKGHFYNATYTATPYASSLTRAAHMQGEQVPVLARLSNGSGDPRSRDYEPDVRGLAVSFKLADGSSTDILSQTAPNFPVDNPKSFVQVVQANVAGLARLWKFPNFLARHPGAVPGLPANLKALAPPRSYATRRYFAIHAFKWVGSDESERFVRYTWVPQAGEQSISGGEAKDLGSDYLVEEMRTRLGRGPVRFDLEVQIADQGDETSDPRHHWPDDRETAVVGTLELTEIDDSAESDGIVVFDPMRLTDGIEASDDRVLAYRPSAYSVSADRRVDK